MKKHVLLAYFISTISYGHAHQPAKYYCPQYSYISQDNNSPQNYYNPEYYSQSNNYYIDQNTYPPNPDNNKSNQHPQDPIIKDKDSENANDQISEEEKSLQEATRSSEDKNDKPESDTKETTDEKNEEKEKSKSPHTFTSNVALVSDYRFRGLSQTMRRPAIQGGFDYSHESGVYFGTWASNADGTTHYYNNTSMEWDIYGGYKGKLCPCTYPDFSYNLGVLLYYYPGGRAFVCQNVKFDTVEYYIELSYKVLSIKFWQTLTNYFGFCSSYPPFNWHKNRYDEPNGSSKGSIYIEGNFTIDLLEKMHYGCLEAGKLSLLLHVGHQYIRHYNSVSYSDWKVMLTQEFDWFSAFVFYVDTNANRAYFDILDNAFRPSVRRIASPEIVFGVTRTF